MGMGETIIKDVDIVLLSGNMTSVYIDMGHYEYSGTDFKTDQLLAHLNRHKSQYYGHKYTWYDANQDFDHKLWLSTSAFDDYRGKKYIAGVEIQDVKIDASFFETTIKESQECEALYRDYRTYTKLLNLEEITFQEAKMKFGGYGDSSFRCQIGLRDQELSVEDYYDYIQFLRKLARLVFKDIVTDIGLTYRETLGVLSKMKDNDFHILDLHLESYSDEKRNSDYLKNRAMQSICWMHCHYNKTLFESEDFVKEMAGLLKDEPVKKAEQTVVFPDTKCFFGWSHTLFVSENEDKLVRRQLCDFYKSTFEIIWGEWEFLQKITRDLDFLSYSTYEILNSKKYLRSKTNKLKNQTNILFYSLKRLMNSFENASVTINQVQTILMSTQKKVWCMDDYRKSFSEKSQILNEKIEYMVNMKKTQQSRILNGVLFVIALLSTIDISNTIYRVIAYGTVDELTISLGPVSVIFVVIVLYNRLTGQ